MIKIVLYISVVLLGAVCCTEPGRPKPRLLFYDEDGNLVKTFSNPYLQNLRMNAGLPVYGNFLRPFFGFIKDFASLFTYTVPVSNEVIQQIRKNPMYHNQLMLTHTREPVIEPNALCEGRRAQIPSPSLCNNYLNCWDGWAVEQECPSGLLFSSKGYCDYSDNVRCDMRKIREQPPTQPRCNKDFQTFVNQLNCNEFFVCVNRQPVKFKCPAGLAYSETLGVCDYATRSNCGSMGGVFADDPSLPTSPVTPESPIIPDSPAASPSTPALPIEAPTPSIPEVPVSPPEMPSTPAPALPADLPGASIPVPSVPSGPPAAPLPIVPIIPPMPLLPAVFRPQDLTTVFTENSIVNSQKPLAERLPSLPVFSSLPSLPSVVQPQELKTVFTENSIVNSQSWTSTHIATSLEDAINQLQRRNIAKISV